MMSAKSSAGVARARPGARGAVHQLQAIGNEARLEHAVARFLDELGDVDAHRTGERAAPAQRAGVINKPFPLLEFSDRHLGRDAEEPVDRRERTGMTVIGLLERPQLVDRRVAGIAGRHVEMAGVGAHAAAHARFQMRGGDRPELVDEAPHRRVATVRVAHIALGVVGNAGGGCLGGHSAAPRCPMRMPVIPRENTNRNACISLPNGNQMKKAQRLRICRVSSVS